jgi:hypothetical protein
VDGVQGKILYGKAPGNIFYRAAALVGGLALGNLIAVDGSALLFWLMSKSDEGGNLLIVLLGVAVGAAVIAWGYRAFRYGEEVEELPAANQKALSNGSAWSKMFRFDLGKSKQSLQMGMNILEELAEKSR